MEWARLDKILFGEDGLGQNSSRIALHSLWNEQDQTEFPLGSAELVRLWEANRISQSPIKSKWNWSEFPLGNKQDLSKVPQKQVGFVRIF